MNTLEKQIRIRQGYGRIWEAINSLMKEPHLRKDLTSKGYLVIDLNSEEGLKSMPRNWKRGFDTAGLDFFVDSNDIKCDNDDCLDMLSHDVKMFYFENGFTKRSDRYTNDLREMGRLAIDTPGTVERELLVHFLNKRNGYELPVVPNGEMDLEVLEFRISQMKKGINDFRQNKYEDLVITKKDRDFHLVICEDLSLKDRHRVIGYEI